MRSAVRCGRCVHGPADDTASSTVNTAKYHGVEDPSLPCDRSSNPLSWGEVRQWTRGSA